MAKINIRNLYIDLLNKIKQSEGVSKDYVDGQVTVIDQHLLTIDGDITAINSVIPETASATNQLITGDDITGSETYGPASSITIEDSEAFNLAACEVNVEPIQDLHGYDYPWVGGSGKNKCPYDKIATNPSEYFTLASGSYTFSFKRLGSPKYSTSKIILRDANQNNLVSVPLTGSSAGDYLSGTFTISESTSCRVLNENVNVDSSGYAIDNIQIESGNERTTFAPYSNICPITGTSSEVITVSDGDDTKNYTIDLDGTRYGGTLNVKTGVLTVTHGFAEYDGSEDESWSLGSSVNGFFLTSTNASQMLYTSNKKTVISNMYETINNTTTWATILARDNVCCITKDGSNNRFTVRTKSIDTVANWRTYLASNPLQVCYELATPITVQLTPVQIQLLTGTVTMSASSGTITVTTTKLTGAVEDLTALVDDILPKLPAPPTTDGSYILTVIVTDGDPVYTWEATT